MYYHQQRCVYIISSQKIPHANIFYADKFYRSIHLQTQYVAGWHTLWRKEQRCPPAIYVFYTIYNPTNNDMPIEYRLGIKNNFHAYIRKINFLNSTHLFSLLAAIHLFISSHDEIGDFCSMDKKTGRRYLQRIWIYTIPLFPPQKNVTTIIYYLNYTLSCDTIII